MLNYTTKIAAHQSIAEISKMLAKAGAKAVMQEYDDDGTIKSLSFSLIFNGNTIGFRLPVNWQAIQSILIDIRRKNTKLERRIAEQEHAVDVAWRVIKDW